jgi:hypothetical protein
LDELGEAEENAVERNLGGEVEQEKLGESNIKISRRLTEKREEELEDSEVRSRWKI